jgi:hopene-associated glycosyltransferase HpnB
VIRIVDRHAAATCHRTGSAPGSRFTPYTYSVHAFVIVGGFSFAAWIYLLLFHGGFWRVASDVVQTRGAQTRPADHALRIVAVVPARNEASVIASCVRSLLAQSGLAQIILIDDNSTDATAHFARAATESAGNSEMLTIIAGTALPAGWSGKVWAMQQGIAAALALTPDYILLTDADIVHSPGSIATLVSIAQENRRDMVSFMAKLHARSVAEKLLIPAFVFFFRKLYPPRWVSDDKSAVAAAAGGCILIPPEALARAGGMDPLRAEIIDDCALARAVKRTGGRIQLSLTDLVRSDRPYLLTDIERMISRTAFNQLRHSALLLLGCMVGLSVLYICPLLLIATATPATTALGAATWLLMIVAYLPIVRFYGLSPLWAVSLPAAAVFYMAATLHSAVTFWTGRGGRWKGRIQDPAARRRVAAHSNSPDSPHAPEQLRS